MLETTAATQEALQTAATSADQAVAPIQHQEATAQAQTDIAATAASTAADQEAALAAAAAVAQELAAVEDDKRYHHEKVISVIISDSSFIYQWTKHH